MQVASSVGETTQVLEQALSSVLIVDHSNPPATLPVQQYTELLRLHRSAYRPDERWALVLFRPLVSDDRTRNQLYSLVRQLLDPHVNEDRVQLATFAIHGGPGNGFEIGDLVANLVRLALVHGAAHAAALLHQAVEVSSCSYTENMLLSGIRLDASSTLTDEIRFITLPPSSRDFPAFMPSFLAPHVSADALAGATVLQLDCKVVPRFLNPTHQTYELDAFGSEFSHQMPLFDGVAFRTEEFVRAMSLVAGHKVAVALRWSAVPPDEITNVSHGGGMQYDLSQIGRGTQPLNAASLQEVMSLYRALCSLGTKDLETLRVPIDRWIESVGPRSLVDRAIDLGIALECLYLGSDRNELSYRLRVRAARHLGDSYSERRELDELVREFYSIRSSAVHNGSVPDSVSVNGDTMSSNEFIALIGQLCLKAIRRFIDNGFPDWRELVLQ